MGLYTITTRASGTVLTGGGSTSDIFNVDHQNHVTHTAAPFVNSFEDTLADMQATTDPAPLGVLSLPAAMSDELRRIRFVIAQIKQKISGATTPPFWYTATAAFSGFVAFGPTACRLEQAVAIDIPSGSITGINMDTVVYDTAGMRSGSSIIAPVDGVYIVGGTLTFNSGGGAAGNFKLFLQQIHGSTGTTIASNQVFSNVTTERKGIVVETVARFQKGDSLTLEILQTNGTTLKPAVGPNDARPALWAAMIARG